MGITNTISELSNYFYQWHKNKYDEIHKATITTQQTIYETIFGQRGIQETLNTLVLNFNNLLNRYNTLTANTNSTIKNLETDINANKGEITWLKNNKIDANKAIQKESTGACWNYVVLAYDPELNNSYPTRLWYNDYLGIGVLFCDLDANNGRAKRPVNKYGYTKFFDFTSVVNEYGNNQYQRYIIDEGRKPVSTFSCFCTNGFNKIRFQPDGKLSAAFRETTAVNDKNGILKAQFIMMYFYGSKK